MIIIMIIIIIIILITSHTDPDTPGPGPPRSQATTARWPDPRIILYHITVYDNII